MQPESAIEEVTAWIRKAESDLKNIELVLPAPDAPLDTVCFHAQQAAEKYLKALLTFHSIPFRKTHDLPELVLLLPRDSLVPPAVGDLTKLTYAAVALRYPSSPTETEYDRWVAEDMVRQAYTVRTAVRDDLALQGYIPK